MRSNEIFAAMSTEEAEAFLRKMREEAPEVANLALGAAATAFRLRPEFLRRQPRTRQAEWMRRALGRTIGAPIAEEVLATYFLDHKLELLAELLDALGVPHEEGRLSEDTPPPPERSVLEKAVPQFLKGDDPETRRLLLQAFASQQAIDWPDLDALVAGRSLPEPAPGAAKKAKAKPKAATKKPKAKAKASKKAKR